MAQMQIIESEVGTGDYPTLNGIKESFCKDCDYRGENKDHFPACQECEERRYLLLGYVRGGLR